MRGRLAGALLALAPAWLAPEAACAQAWAAPAGTGAVTVSVQAIDNTGHLMSNGKLLPDGKSRNVSTSVEVDYAVSDRWGLSASLPYVFARFLGPGPSPANLPVDACRCWQRGWQDVNVAVRYALVDGPVGLTVSAAVGVPSHGYRWQGEAVVGYGLREARVALDAGLRLDPISPRLALLGRYQYAAVEDVSEVPDVANNRSNWSAGVSAAVTTRWSARVTLSGQRTHGGLRFGSMDDPELLPPGEANTFPRFRQHDRLLRNNFLHAGAGVTYSLPRVDLFASYVHFLSGTDTHAGKAFTTGVSWPFGR